MQRLRCFRQGNFIIGTAGQRCNGRIAEKTSNGTENFVEKGNTYYVVPFPAKSGETAEKKRKNVKIPIEIGESAHYNRKLYVKFLFWWKLESKKDTQNMQNEHLRNVAIIAHVDHGKTTLVDEMLKQGGVYRENQEVVDRVMDSGDLERERGHHHPGQEHRHPLQGREDQRGGHPGHADFGGEVERILKMVNGVILLVDAAEGPMPQTRFVLSKALELGHWVIVVVNKIDRPDQRIHEVIDEVLELLMDLDATPEQLDSPMLFCSGRRGTASYSPDVVGTGPQAPV